MKLAIGWGDHELSALGGFQRPHTIQTTTQMFQVKTRLTFGAGINQEPTHIWVTTGSRPTKICKFALKKHHINLYALDWCNLIQPPPKKSLSDPVRALLASSLLLRSPGSEKKRSRPAVRPGPPGPGKRPRSSKDSNISR